ncbi:MULTISPECIES: ash family protein [unclassified Lonepinella]|uniref:ash family protein n=1 Tax=unclassified Lonepinella TaxID=2642006 RepID=UPI0036DE7002
MMKFYYIDFTQKINKTTYLNINNHKKRLTKCGDFCEYFCNGRDNPTKTQTANNCTPLNRAFFIRSIRTHQANRLLCLSSMIACNGQPLAVGSFPFETVCHPVARYRQAVTSKGDNFINQQTELSAMIYLFLGIHRQHLGDTSRTVQRLPKARLIINADSEHTARAKIARDYCLLQCWNVKNPEHLHRTLTNVKGVIYA